MKVVTQLVRHFWQRGALTQMEVETLLRHGFVRISDLPGFKPRKVDPDEVIGEKERTAPPIEPVGALDLVEESLKRRPARHGHEQKGSVLEIDEICERVRAEYQRRERDLASLLALGKRFEDCDTWYDAAIALRQLPPDKFYEGLCTDLASNAVLLGDLWQASDPEPLHLLVSDDEARGRAARAFLALLVANDSLELGRYAWVLKHDEMKAVINLRVVHERLLVGLSRLHLENSRLLTAALQRNSDTVQFWALLLLYNARREPGIAGVPDYGREYGPVALPEIGVWQSAWTSALAMDRPAVTNLLLACYKEVIDTEEMTRLVCGQGLMCPVGWHCP